jgi:molybdopterin-containing oxidoreductase family iron-sulfur binding subunit
MSRVGNRGNKMERRDFLKITGGTLLAGSSCGYAFRFLTSTGPMGTKEGSPLTGRKWGMLVNLNKCEEGCVECIEACREENNVSLPGDDRWDIHWIRKVKIEGKTGASTSEKSVLLLCNHCDNPPCAQVCPVRATYKREDGVVIVDHHRCIGCRYCMIACPYNARFFNFKDDHDWRNKDRPKRSHGVAEACHLCAHRLDVGQKPACVEVCDKKGVGALTVGDLNDKESKISEIINTSAVKRIREDLGTEPKVYYIGL